MAGISFRNVTKRYGKTVAVKNVSFDILDNEFFCFFGPPLSGKSTILKLILGLETPDEGEILIDGKPVVDVSPADRNVAMVFQNLGAVSAYDSRPECPLSTDRASSFPLEAINSARRFSVRKTAHHAIFCTSCPPIFPVASASVSPLPGRWCAIRWPI